MQPLPDDIQRRKLEADMHFWQEELKAINPLLDNDAREAIMAKLAVVYTTIMNRYGHVPAKYIYEGLTSEL